MFKDTRGHLACNMIATPAPGETYQLSLKIPPFAVELGPTRLPRSAMDIRIFSSVCSQTSCNCSFKLSCSLRRG